MTTRRLMTSMVLALVVNSGAPVWAAGAEEPSTPRDIPAARAALDQSLPAIRTFKTLNFEVNDRWETGGRFGVKTGNDNRSTTMQVWVTADPARFAIKAGDFDIRCDGSTLWVSVPALKQFNQSSLAPDTDLGELVRTMTDQRITLPLIVEAVVRPKQGWNELIDGLVAVTGMSTGEAGNKPVRWITYAAKDTVYKTSERVTGAIAVDTTSGMLLRQTVDYSIAYRASMPPDPSNADSAAPRSMQYSHKMTNLKTDEPLDSALFTFTPADGDTKVDAFKWPEAPPPSAPATITREELPQGDLVGTEVPAFTGKMLDDKAFNIADLRGRIVVLDFWATWCPPCVRGIPHLQSVHEHFADKPVTVIGINRDTHGDEPKIKKFLERKKITFGHVLDFSGSIAAKFNVNAIPTTLLIDAKGVVVNVDVGFAPEQEDQLLRRIHKMLAEMPDANKEKDASAPAPAATP